MNGSGGFCHSLGDYVTDLRLLLDVQRNTQNVSLSMYVY
jgi:hypothetical protein